MERVTSTLSIVEKLKSIIIKLGGFIEGKRINITLLKKLLKKKKKEEILSGFSK